MKRIAKILCSALLLFSTITMSADKETKPSLNPPTIITILHPDTIHERSMCDMPQAYYMAGYINISFNSVEEHIVNVNVMNLNRGTQVQELVNTSVMSIAIDINQILSAGDYTLELVYDNGNTYVGYFTL